MLWDCTTR